MRAFWKPWIMGLDWRQLPTLKSTVLELSRAKDEARSVANASTFASFTIESRLDVVTGEEVSAPRFFVSVRALSIPPSVPEFLNLGVTDL
mmetsp:Transcript_2461/g.4338  ORF Transcript_2461/g.4338 Transcript_2461/m.4338 type:complete len:90 (-) Transcript_2461:518-787(-)